MAGIAAAQPGNRIGDISAAVEDVAGAGGYGIVRQFVGHGIGTAMHEEPQVPNFRTGAGRQARAGPVPGDRADARRSATRRPDVLADSWTVVTADRSLAAHFEHTIAITADGPEILTTV